MKIALLALILLSDTNAFQIKPISQKAFPKVSYTKIHDISYRKPIYIRRKRPFIVTLIKELTNITTNYIDEIYAMASMPLSYNFVLDFNATYFNNTYFN